MDSMDITSINIQLPKDRTMTDSSPAQSTPKFSTKKKLTFGLLALLILVCTVELIGHIGFYFVEGRTLFAQRANKVASQFTMFGGWEPVPNVPYRSVGQDGFVYQVDRHGVYHNGYDRDLAPDDYTVLVFGGSTVMGLGATPNIGSIPAQLEEILNEEGFDRNIRVINAGRSGYISYQQLSSMRQGRYWDMNPDLIIWIDGRNDATIMACHTTDWRPNWVPYYDEVSDSVNAMFNNRTGLQANLHTLLYNHSMIYGVGFKLVESKIQSGPAYPTSAEPTPEVLDECLSVYLENHRMAELACGNRDVPYYGFLQPTLTSSLKPIHADEVKFIEAWGEQFPGGIEGTVFYDTQEEWYRHASDRIAKEGRMHDLSELFKGRSEVLYVDSCHYTDEGNRLIAAHVASIVSPEIKRAIAEEPPNSGSVGTLKADAQGAPAAPSQPGAPVALVE